MDALVLICRMTSHMRESDALKTLESEKEKLISEKHKLKDDVTAARRKADDDSKTWSSERRDMQKSLDEKQKECDKLKKEIEKLNEQVRVTSQHGSKQVVSMVYSLDC